MRECDRMIVKTLLLAEQMIETANRGDEVREDDGCGILYGTLRDAGYRIRTMAQKEMEKHKQKGLWKEEEI